ncbi:MAG TPA: zinc ribbon domain-containing protein [Candidatus Angelobacter sp.]|nr:zinc ribbon domain-containing protein [Candidatus Angelobacter sp.]
MLCTFCGTENRPEYKFCGSCGVRLERRQLERRKDKSGISTKCESCEHVNEPGMKFCGMCGTRIERRMADRRGASDETRAAALANAQLPSPQAAARRPARAAATAVEEDEPVALPRRNEPAIFREEGGRKESVRNGSGDSGRISGPSFLGLNAEPESTGGAEYLLEDEPSGGGLRKLVLLLIIAAIAALLYVQWRSSFKANPKPAPTKAEPSTPAPGPQGSNMPQPPAVQGNPSDGIKTAATGAAAFADGAAATDANVPKVQPTALEREGTASNATAEDTSDKKPPPDEVLPKADSKAPEEAKLPDYKPSAALVRAQQYIRGAGVQQNCEQGLLYLKAATDKSDPGAAIQMAALYSSGLCVKQDRVMAYRWFNSAHELQPANMWIQKNMDQLWAQMSSQERRLAGY